MIEIKIIDETTCEVTVESRTSTRHTVHLNQDYAEQLVGSEVPIETLVRKSFEFLLEREPNTSILRTFDLSVIERYFPDYRKGIVSRIAG